MNSYEEHVNIHLTSNLEIILCFVFLKWFKGQDANLLFYYSKILKILLQNTHNTSQTMHSGISKMTTILQNNDPLGSNEYPLYYQKDLHYTTQ